MKFINGKNIVFKYKNDYDNSNEDIIDGSIKALDNLDISVNEGEFVAILGHNGSGKSTLAKLINGFFLPSDGVLIVNGFDTSDKENIWNVRQSAGMVFQNPDNQFVATIVEDDVAFGPQNLGIEPLEIRKRVDESLKTVKMYEFRESVTSDLSGGQKQRVSIAGILAMKPKCIIFDEATAMLDPVGRKDVLDTILKLNKEQGITIIIITHYMEEVTYADRVLVIEKGKFCLEGTPREIFSNVEKIRELKLDVPQINQLAYNLKNIGIDIPTEVIDINEFAQILMNFGINSNVIIEDEYEKVDEYTSNIIEVNNVTHLYSQNSVFEKKAIEDISFNIGKGEFLGIVGHTGSGKSTLIQTLNGLLIPSYGDIIFEGQSIRNCKNIKTIRQQVGVVFQYPEYQIFEETIYKDVAFGPKNMELSEEEVHKRVKYALDLVGISEELYDNSPFELSGGQKRRVAIAGILAMKPKVLVLDEPTAGLDPFGREEILTNIKRMHDDLGITVVLISHSMEDVCRFAERIIVLENGKIKAHGHLSDIFSNAENLRSAGILLPQISLLINELRKKGFHNLPKNIYTVEKAFELFKKILR